MTEENKTDKKKCGKKSQAMFAYGIIQLGSNVISAVALAAIALSFCSLKQESKVFNDCIEEVQAKADAQGKNILVNCQMKTDYCLFANIPPSLEMF